MNLRPRRFSLILLWLINCLLALPLIIYSIATVYTRPAYDDFCDAVVFREFGIVGSLHWWYENYTGRVLAYLIGNTITALGSPIGSSYVVLLVLICWMVLFSIFKKLFRSVPYNQLQAATASSFLMIATIAALPSIATTLYWYIGEATYLTSLTMLLIFIWVALQKKHGNSGLSYLLCFLLALAMWLISEITGTVILIVAISVIVIGFFRHIPDQLKKCMVAGLIGCLVSLPIVLGAPGNRMRQQLWSITPDLSYAFDIAVSSPGAPGLISFINAPLSTLAAFVIPFGIAYYGPTASDDSKRRQSRLAVLAIFGATLILIGACFGAVAYVAHTPLTIHAWLIPIFIFLCAFISWGHAWGLSFKPDIAPAALPTIVEYLIVGGLIIVASAALRQSANTFDVQKTYAQAWDHREAMIKAKIVSGEAPISHHPFGHPYGNPEIDPDIVPLQVESIDQVSPFRWEPGVSPVVFPNMCIARYYGLEAITVPRNN